jgi:hypothetical protein
MAVDMLAKRDVLEMIIPDDATSPNWGAGASWAWGSWSQVVASLANDMVITQAQLNELVVFTTGPLICFGQFQIGVGGSGSEVAIAQFGTGLGAASDGTTENKNIFTNKTHFVAPVFVAAGSRVAFRAAGSVASGFVGSVKLVGYDARDFAAMLRQPRHDRWLRSYRTTSVGATVEPSAGVTTVTSAASSWGYGSWVEFVASASKPRLVTGVISGIADVTLHPTFQVGLGGAGSEVAHGQLPVTGRSGLPFGPGVAYFYRPVYVKSGERIAVRCKDNSASAKGYSVMLLSQEIE